MLLINQEDTGVFFGNIKHTLRKTAFAEQAEQTHHTQDMPYDFQPHHQLSLSVRNIRRLNLFNMILTLSGKYPLVLIVYCHYINLCITVIIIQPIRTDTGRNKRNFSLFAYTRKYIFTDVLIRKCHEFFNKVFSNLIQNNLHIVQFQLTFIGVNIPKPETDEIVCDKYKPFLDFSGFFSVTGVLF